MWERIGDISKDLTAGAQEDAAVFLREMLAHLDVVADPKASPRDQKCQLSKLLEGKATVKRTACPGCKKGDTEIEVFRQINLPVRKNNSLAQQEDYGVTVHESIQVKMKSEKAPLCCGNGKCRRTFDTRRTWSLAVPPQIMCITLARFECVQEQSRKLCAHVEPSLQLRISMGAGRTQKTVEYSLDGVVVHVGASLTTGHFYAYIRRGQQWYKVNDDHPVEEVTEQVVLNDQAYLCFYRKDD